MLSYGILLGTVCRDIYKTNDRKKVHKYIDSASMMHIYLLGHLARTPLPNEGMRNVANEGLSGKKNDRIVKLNNLLGRRIL